MMDMTVYMYAADMTLYVYVAGKSECSMGMKNHCWLRVGGIPVLVSIYGIDLESVSWYHKILIPVY